MTDKEKLAKVRAEIERRKKLHEKSLINPIHEGFGLQNVIKAKISELTYLLSFIDSIQEEPTTSVWHNITEEPKIGKWILLPHSDGWYHVGCMSKGKFDKFWVSDGTAAFLLSAFSKWAYVEDLLKL